MKEKDKKILVGAGAVALLGLAVYAASRGSGRDEPLNLGGGGGVAGGGMPAVFAGGVDGTGEGTGQAPVTYSVAFPDVSIPTMPVYTPTVDTGGGGSYPSLPADTSTMQPGTYQTGGKKVTVSAPFVGEPTVSQPAPGAGEGFGGGGAGGRGGATPAGDVSGIPGGSSTKKGATVGAGTAPGGLPGLVGNLIGGIGGLFGW